MTTPRFVIVNREITRFYPVISRCVRRAHLCGDGKDHRKNWLESRLKELAGIFAIDVCAYRDPGPWAEAGWVRRLRRRRGDEVSHRQA